MAHPSRRLAAYDVPDVGEPDQHVLLRNITWEQYVALADSRGESASPRLTYLEGELVLTSLSGDHERAKKLIARLIDAYDEEREIGLVGMGSTTFRAQAQQRGLEPDECYCIGAQRELPDFAIEVALRAGYIDKLAVYAGLGVAEVWFWVRGAFYVHVLDGATGEYRERGRSRTRL